MDIIKLKPDFKDIIWGGRRMKGLFGYDTALERIAEAWVVSAHPQGTSTVCGGEFDGMDFGGLVASRPELAGAGPFPLLVKFIDAAGDLSIQVHPDDAYAASHEGGFGKTEMWYVVEAEPDAFIYLGFERPVSREEFSAAIDDGSVCELLKKVPCRAGDSFFIPAGTVHAIGRGLLICEVQQSSDITYRVFDYGRKGADGLPRQLHTKQAIECSALEPADAGRQEPEVFAGGARIRRLAQCEYFTVSRICAAGDANITVGDGNFAVLAVLEGCAALRCGRGAEVVLSRGEGALVPGGCGGYDIKNIGGGEFCCIEAQAPLAR